jgi:catechol 2,3-dioxygenase-like lactoylglutathione lyase family enzyme
VPQDPAHPPKRGPAVGIYAAAIAFAAPDRAAVRAFFQAAVDAHADVRHEPRVWPEYHPDYYGAFVRDPDGNNVEAVCRAPGWSSGPGGLRSACRSWRARR